MSDRRHTRTGANAEARTEAGRKPKAGAGAAKAGAARAGAGRTQLPDPEPLSFARDGHELRLFRWARPDAHRLLLVHGIGMGHSVYDRFVSTARHECEVICVDLPGFGDAPEPEHAASIRQTAELLAACIRELDLAPLTAVGHSMGSQVVAELAARHSELLECLVLIAPTVNRHERTARQQAMRMLQDLANNTPPVMAKGLLAYIRTGPRWFVKKLGPTLAHRIEECLPSIPLRTLVLRGERDAVSPHDWAQEVTALLPHGHLEELEDRGHEALISSGEPAARRVLDWIAAGSGGTPSGTSGDATDHDAHNGPARSESTETDEDRRA